MSRQSLIYKHVTLWCLFFHSHLVESNIGVPLEETTDEHMYTLINIHNFATCQS
jgi:hypothetical protein